MDLRKVINSIPEQLGAGMIIENEEYLKSGLTSILVCGMGGSGVLGELLAALFPNLNIKSHHSYDLPLNIAANTLIIICSYSGNTEETLSSYQAALKKDLPTVVISGGGTLLNRAKRQSLPYILVPHKKNIPTRFMTGYLVRAGYIILAAAGFIRENKENFNEEIKKGVVTSWSNVAKSLAADIEDKIVLIYTSANLFGLGYIWKESLNETAKVPAFLNIVPEMNHNEIESLGSLKEKTALFLIDPQEREEIKEKFGAMSEVFRDKGWPYREINLSHPERIIDLANTLTLALSVSLILAEKKGLEPTLNPTMDALKEKSS